MQTADGVRVVVTGGSSGIGYDVARRFAQAGAEVAITGQDPESLRAAAETIRARTIALTLNDPHSVARFFRELGDRQVDVFLANAGSPERRADDQAAQTAGALSVVARAAPLVTPGGVLAVTNTLFTQYPVDQVPDEFKAYVRGKQQLAIRIGEVGAAHPSVRVLDIALGFVDGTKGLIRIKTADEVAAYTRYMASATPGGKLTTVSEAGAFIFDLLRQTPGGVRAGIDGSIVSLVELAASAPGGSSNHVITTAGI
jgi:NAD(P)-dependent dehydrogenase (short-subunit alcohol dehydrogenase family)